MNVYIDTEFVEDGRTIDLLSIGLVNGETGEKYYAQNSDCDMTRANPWVRQNVFPFLTKNEWKTHDAIRDEVEMFLFPYRPFKLWGYCSGYDWIAFCQLWGTMASMPKKFPQLCYDIEQWRRMLGCKYLPTHSGNKHHALEDALWTRDCWKYLKKYEEEVCQIRFGR